MEENQNQLEKLNRIRLTDYYFRKLRTTEQVWMDGNQRIRSFKLGSTPFMIHQS